MNLFRLHDDPVIAASFMCDKHVVKMILETAQILSTAIRLLDGKKVKVPYVNPKGLAKNKNYHRLDSSADDVLMMDTHRHHPCTRWVMCNRMNYYWAYDHLLALLREYTRRYGKIHSVERRSQKFYPWSFRSVFEPYDTLMDLLMRGPKKYAGGDLSIPVCMSEKFKVPDDPVDSYRNFYAAEKSRFAKWKTGNVPSWYPEKLAVYFPAGADIIAPVQQR